MLATKDVPKQILRNKKDQLLSSYGMIADQAPKGAIAKYWLHFMGKEVPVFVGGEVLVQAGEQRGYGLILLEVDIFVFDATPEPFDEDIVEAPTTSIHTDADVGLF